MRRLPLLLLAAVLILRQASSQDSLFLTHGFSEKPGFGTRKAMATGLVGAIMVSTWYDAYNTWWKGAEKPFSFFTETWLGPPHLGIDKFGHFFGTYVIFKIVRDMMLWGGYNRSTSTWWAAGLSAFNGFQIEMGDAFSPYGFDYQDLIVDMAGVAYGLMQTEVPFLRNFDLKVSYWSKKGFASPVNFTQDYDAMTIWMAFNVHGLLPTSMKEYWPKFLNIAVGYGVDNRQTRREIAVGLDMNLESFTTSSEDVLLAERIGDVVHWPAPAVKFTQEISPQYYLFHLY